MIEFGNVEHGSALSRVLRRAYDPAKEIVISRSEGGELLGGVIYDDYRGPAIWMHPVGVDDHWLSRDVLWVCFDYPFNQLKCKKVCGQIPSSNSRLLAFMIKLGFKVEAVIKDIFPDGDMLFMGMYRDECRWLKLQPRSVRRGC